MARDYIPTEIIVKRLCNETDFSLLAHIPRSAHTADGNIPIAIIEKDGNTGILFVGDDGIFMTQFGITNRADKPVRELVILTATSELFTRYGDNIVAMEYDK